MLRHSGAKLVCTGALCFLTGISVTTSSFAQNAATARTQGGEHDKAQPIIRAASSGELKVSRRHPVSPDVVINLINLMVENKMIKQSQADALIKQAQDEAYVSRQATKEAAMKAAQATREADAAAAAVTPPGTRRVVYVPEIVKHELREEIKREVLRTAQREAWASPGAYPEWASRIYFQRRFPPARRRHSLSEGECTWTVFPELQCAEHRHGIRSFSREFGSLSEPQYQRESR